MKTYKILWVTKEFGESFVTAKNEKEAHGIAKRGLDRDFERYDSNNDWEISGIQEVEE